MAQDILQKLENRKAELEKEIALKENEMRDLSRQVSECQVSVLELRGELKGLLKMIESLKGEK